MSGSGSDPTVEDGDEDDRETATVTVIVDDARTELVVPVGTTLRDALLAGGCSPYTALTERLNCGGRGICATCGVRVQAGSAPATHLHDRLAARAGYPRLSCQLTVRGDMTVEIPPKLVWGGRE